MKLTKALKRESKKRKQRYGMQVDGKSIFEIKQSQKKRAKARQKDIESKLLRLDMENASL